MKFKEKQMHPWSCDMSRGDTQCPFVSPSGGGYMSCTWRIGHPADLPHEIVHDQTTPPPKRDWFISPESLEEYADAIRGPELARAASVGDQGLRKAAENIVDSVQSGQAVTVLQVVALKAALTRQDGPESTQEPPSPLPHCFACLQGQRPEVGEGTHLEGTVEHPSQQETPLVCGCVGECSGFAAEKKPAPASVQPPISDDVVERIAESMSTVCCPGLPWEEKSEHDRKYWFSQAEKAWLIVRREARAGLHSWESVEKAIRDSLGNSEYVYNRDAFITLVLKNLTQDGKAEPDERVNLVAGDRVQLISQRPGETFTIESSSIYGQRKFYRLKEINGGLFLRESLRLDAQGGNP